VSAASLLAHEEGVIAKQLTFLLVRPEPPRVSLAAFVIIESDLLDDVRIEQLLDVVVDGGLAQAVVEVLEFVYRRECVGLLEDVNPSTV
jgi:hypothetical protein